MWMTGGLGIAFFFLYLLIALLGSHLKNPDLRLDFFFFAYENPTFLIYIGLFVFALFSTSIYLVRVLIKYFYNTRKY